MEFKSLRQLGILFWKNLLLQQRKRWLTVVEMAVPCVIACAFMVLRQQIGSTQYSEPRRWGNYSVDSIPRELADAESLKAADKSLFGGSAIPKPYIQNGLLKYKLCYVPHHPALSSIMQTVRSLPWIDPEDFSFDSEDTMLDKIRVHTKNRTLLIWGCIVFNETSFMNDTALSKAVTYTIRPISHHTFLTHAGITGVTTKDVAHKIRTGYGWNTDRMYPQYPLPGPRESHDPYGGSPYYYNRGFLSIQRALDRAIMLHFQPTLNTDMVDVRLERFAYPPYVEDPFITAIQQLLPIMILLTFVGVVPNLCKDIVVEKEVRLKEYMKLMGLRPWIHWTSWYLKCGIFLFVTVLMTTIIYIINVGTGAVLTYIDPTLFFSFLMLYNMTTVLFCFAVSIFCEQANNAQAIGAVCFFFSYIPYMILSRYKLGLYPRLAISLLHNVAMGYGCFQISLYEGTGAGLRWSNINEPVTLDEELTMAHIFGMLILDSLIFIIIIWYFDNVWPGEFGIPQPYYFPFTKSYWCGEGIEEANLDQPQAVLDDEFFESPPTHLKAGIQIQGLRKVFKVGNKKRVAVEGLTVDFYEGQITALLGHNGAGKTTTMSMLTCFLKPTSGTALVNGHDICTDVSGVRRSLGFCPQHDVLFDSLTVREHLIFFSKLKGLKGNDVDLEVYHMLQVLHLEDKIDEKAQSLSGGMKRKLSVGIALCADSKVVFLDEPTSGMDPEARRQMWDILQSQLTGRTFILSTHFMDEADLLGDRIVIMADGILRCCGSSMFLKRKFGIGYHMVMVKMPDCDVDEVTKAVKKFVPESELENSNSAELSFILPSDSVGEFEALFTYLEQYKDDLGISNFGASVTTMEEVFMKVLKTKRGDEGKDIKKIIHPKNSAKSLEQVPSMENDLAKTAEAVQDANINDDSPENKTTTVDSPENKTSTADSPQEIKTSTADSPEYPSHIIQSTGDDDNQNQVDDINIRLKSDKNRSKETNNVILDDEKRDTDTLAEVKITLRKSLKPVLGIEQKKNSGVILKIQQLRAMLMKRFLFIWRSLSITTAQISIPIVFTIMACVVNKIVPDKNAEPLFELGMKQFPFQNIPIISPNTSKLSQALTTSYMEYIREKRTKDKIIRVDRVETFENMNMADYIGYIGSRNRDLYHKTYTFAADFYAINQSRVKMTSYYNNQAYHPISIALNLASNTIIRALLGADFSITANNHPLPEEQKNILDEAGQFVNLEAFLTSMLMCFGFAILTSSFTMFLIQERVCKSKHIQFVSGVDPLIFWLSTMACDYLVYLIPCILVIPVFTFFEVEAYIKHSGEVSFVLLWYGWAILPYNYIASHMFEVPSSGAAWLAVINVTTALLSQMSLFIIRTPGLGTQFQRDAMHWVYLAFLPNFCFGQAINDIYTNFHNIELCSASNVTEEMCSMIDALPGASHPCCPSNCEREDVCLTHQVDYFHWQFPGIGKHTFFLTWQGIILAIIILLSESSFIRGLIQTIKSSTMDRENDLKVDDVIRGNPADGLNMNARGPERIVQDMDVLREEKFINNTDVQILSRDYALAIISLRRFYGNFLAVDRLSVGIRRGEVFGLLGVNGAGKTTTFKMLTGDIQMSSGDVFLDGCNLRTDIKKVQSRLGYCPQFDALIDKMTVRETLTMYARLRGVKENLIKDIVTKIIQALLLDDHELKRAKDLSGGNKRKLSTGLAIVGDPPVIFLDEPTTGMDPVARRKLWDCLNTVRESGRTIVLTSHSMEECEALCTRIAIMVNGRFWCLGSTQNLKSKFGEGYTLLIKILSADNREETGRRISTMIQLIVNTYPGAILKDSHDTYLHFHIEQTNNSWGVIFGMMEKTKIDYFVEDYSVSQTSLDQVFLNFARAQLPPRRESPTCGNKCCNCCRFFCCCACGQERNKLKKSGGIEEGDVSGKKYNQRISNDINKSTKQTSHERSLPYKRYASPDTRMLSRVGSIVNVS